MLTTEELIAQSKAMIEQTKAEGSKPFFGSVYDISKKELGVMTTDIGAGYKQELDKSLQNMTGQVDINYQIQPNETTEQYKARIAKYNAEKTPTITPTPAKEAIGDSSITYINPETGQTQTRDATTMTPDDLQGLINQGYAIQDVGKNVSSWISQNNPEMGRALVKDTAAEKEFTDAKAALLASTTATADQGTLNAIAALYDARKADMERINAQRQGSISTLGVRTGSRYTGGEGGVFGGIISAEERAGAARIIELEAQKQEAISAANEAARTKKWTQYSKFVELAETRYKETQDVLKELNKTAVEQNKKVKEQMIKASRDSAVSDLISQGITDPTELLNMLNYDESGKLIGDFTIEEIGKVIDVIKKATKSENIQGDVGEWQDALTSGAIPQGTTLFSYLEQKKKATITLREQPTSYQEWSLAGSPGTYQDWVKKGKESDVDIRQKKKDTADLLGQVTSYKSRDEAISELNKYKSSIIMRVDEDGYKQLEAEVDRLFPPPKEEIKEEKVGEISGVFETAKSFFSRLFQR